MAGINNIIGAYNINPRRISSKLSFEVGQVFAAKIMATSEMNKELILRLLDGWQFPAKLEKPLDFIPEGLIKLQVEGFQDGKLLIKLVNPNNEEKELDKDSIDELLLKSKIDVDKEDYDILKNMVKHSMPLTKDNISTVKTIFDFRDKLFQGDDEAESFISKYISSKGIEQESPQANEIEAALKGFFKELKNISEDDILTMLENNIDLTEDNIKSFVKLNSGSGAVYDDLKDISKELGLSTLSINQDVKSLLTSLKSSPNFTEEAGQVLRMLDNKLQDKGLTSKELELYNGLKQLLKDNNAEETSNNADYSKLLNTKDGFEQIKPKSIDSGANKNSVDNDDQNITGREEIVKDSQNKASENTKTTEKNNIKGNKLDINLVKKEAELTVKQQLSAKTEEMKDIIKAILEKSEKAKPEVFDKIIETLKSNINDFKVFNSLSSQYYTLEVPVNINKDEYNCKLLIKDDRKSGKRIDSKNVNMVVSVDTVNIGTVDAFIKVKDYQMSINLKCDEGRIKLLSGGKDSIVQQLGALGYNVFFNVEKREKEATLTNCRDFFDDSSINSINVKV